MEPGLLSSVRQIILMTCFYVLVSGDGTFTIKFVSYKDDYSCDTSTACDFYFKGILYSSRKSNKKDFKTKTYGDTNNVVFGNTFASQSVSFGSNENVTVEVTVMDEDSIWNAPDDKVRDLKIAFPIVRTKPDGVWVKQELGDNWGSFVMSYKIECTGNFGGVGCIGCKGDYYGNKCGVKCVPEVTKTTNYTCDSQTGGKVCGFGRAPPDCRTCQPDYFTDTCTKYCKDKPSQYTCSSNGNRTCEGNWTGDQCDTCKDDHYGPTCSTVCVAVAGNYTCDPTDGSVVCLPGKTGSLCDQCDLHFYLPNCTRYCKPVADQYNCTTDGTKICYHNWKGDDCDTCNTSYYGARCNKTCTPGQRYTCNSNGDIACTGNYSNATTNCTDCKEGYYGQHCNTFCKDTANYTCSVNGSKVCIGHRTGESCLQCEEDYYTKATCDVYCKETAQYKCDNVTGGRVCKERWDDGGNCTGCGDTWYGDNCNISCIPTTAYGCHGNGTKQCKGNRLGVECDKCKPDFYTESCNVNCVPNANYTCNTTDGTPICRANKIGVNCTACAAHHYGVTCNVTCIPHHVRFTCDRDGGKVCKAGYHGDECEDYCVPVPGVFSCSETGDKVCEGQRMGANCTECKEGVYGADCDIFCTGVEERSVCDKDGNLICIGRSTGVNCSECLEGWTGELCNICVQDHCQQAAEVLAGKSTFSRNVLIICVSLGCIVLLAAFITIRTHMRNSKHRTKIKTLNWINNNTFTSVANSRPSKGGHVTADGAVDVEQFAYNNPVFVEDDDF